MTEAEKELVYLMDSVDTELMLNKIATTPAEKIIEYAKAIIARYPQVLAEKGNV